MNARFRGGDAENVHFASESSPSSHSSLLQKAFVVAHDQLRFDLLDSVHRHAHDNQQGSSAEVEIHVQSVQHPGGKVGVKPRPSHPDGQVVDAQARRA